jgi:hypothetical protein
MNTASVAALDCRRRWSPLEVLPRSAHLLHHSIDQRVLPVTGTAFHPAAQHASPAERFQTITRDAQQPACQFPLEARPADELRSADAEASFRAVCECRASAGEPDAEERN